MRKSVEEEASWIERFVSWLGLAIDYDLTIPGTADLAEERKTPEGEATKPEIERTGRMKAFGLFKFAPPH